MMLHHLNLGWKVFPVSILDLNQLFWATERAGGFQKRVFQSVKTLFAPALADSNFWDELAQWSVGHLEQWQRTQTIPQICKQAGLLPLESSGRTATFNPQEVMVLQAMALEAAMRLIATIPQNVLAQSLPQTLWLQESLVADFSVVDTTGLEPIAIGLPLLAPSAMPWIEEIRPDTLGTLERAARQLPGLRLTLVQQAPIPGPPQEFLARWLWEIMQGLGVEVGYVALLLVKAAGEHWGQPFELSGYQSLAALHWQIRTPTSHGLKKMMRLVQMLTLSHLNLVSVDLAQRSMLTQDGPLWLLESVASEYCIAAQPQTYNSSELQMVRLHLRPGPWFQTFTQFFGPAGETGLQHCARWAAQVLALDPTPAPFIPRLAVFFLFTLLSNAQKSWLIMELLQAVEGLLPERIAAQSFPRQQALMQQWQEAIAIFQSWGWQLSLTPDASVHAGGQEAESYDWQTWLTLRVQVFIPNWSISVPTTENADLVTPAAISALDLRQALAQTQMSQARLARLLKVDRSTVNRWINGSRQINLHYQTLLYQIFGKDLQSQVQ
jgi:predicted XRE-type DNA-binding protein